MPSLRGRRPPPVLPILALALAVGMVVNPSASVSAAREGLSLWWTSVLPCLFPFFVLSDLMQATGVVKALGTLLEPLMRPLFALPGAAGFALAVGFTSGPPGGARAAAKLTAEGFLTREEGSRLAAFANAAGPLFVTGVTATSLFRVPAAAPLLAFAHYGAALLTGMILARGAASPPRPRRAPRTTANRAWNELRSATDTAPPLGRLLGSVVREAGESALMVGGFIVFFSVLVGLLEQTGGVRLLAAPGEWVAQRLGLPEGLVSSGVAGLLEVTAGLSRVASAPGPLPARLALASILLSWSGLSIHAQAAAVSAPAGLSYRRFLTGRALQVFLSPVLLFAVWPLAPVLQPATPVFRGLRPPPSGSLAVLGRSAQTFALVLGLLLLLAALPPLSRGLRRPFCVIWVPPRRRP